MPRLRTVSGMITELSDRSCGSDRMGASMVKCSDPMDLRPADENSLPRSTIREFAETETASHIHTFREPGRFPAEILPKFADFWLGLFSSRYGFMVVRGDRQLPRRNRKSALSNPFSSEMMIDASEDLEAILRGTDL